jgi:hypothetical protein
MMEAVRTSETSIDNHFTRQYIPEDNSEHQVEDDLSSGMQRHEGSSSVLPDVSEVVTATIIGEISSTSHVGSNHL